MCVCGIQFKMRSAELGSPLSLKLHIHGKMERDPMCARPLLTHNTTPGIHVTILELHTTSSYYDSNHPIHVLYINVFALIHPSSLSFPAHLLSVLHHNVSALFHFLQPHVIFPKQ